MDNSGFQKIKEIEFTENSARPTGRMRPRMFRQAMIKDRDNNIYGVYGDRLKKGSGPDLGPWDIRITGTGKLKVAPGLVGGILPSNWEDEISFNQNGLSYMVVDCQSDGKVVTAASISADSSPPTQQTPGLHLAPSSFKIAFAVLKDGEAIKTVRAGHISVSPTIVLSLQNPSPTPGLNVVNRYYIWGLL